MSIFIALSLAISSGSVGYKLLRRIIEVGHTKAMGIILLETYLSRASIGRLFGESYSLALEVYPSCYSSSMHATFLSRMYIYLGEVVRFHIGGYRVHLIGTSPKDVHALNGNSGALCIHIVKHRLPSVSPTLDKANVIGSSQILIYRTRKFYIGLNLLFTKFLSYYDFFKANNTVFFAYLSVSRTYT